MPTGSRSGWATATWTRVATSQVTSASICHEAGGFPACSRWSRSEATTPPGTRAEVNSGIPAGLPASRAGLGWHPFRVRSMKGFGDRWYCFAQPPATCCQSFGFEERMPCGPSLGGPRRHSRAMGCPGFWERMNGWRPWDPSVGHTIRAQGRSREPKNFLRSDQGPPFNACSSLLSPTSLVSRKCSSASKLREIPSSGCDPA